MKQPHRKSSILALVGSPRRSVTPAEERAAALKESFDGWLISVAPTLLHSAGALLQSAGHEQNAVTKPAKRSISYVDHIRVNRATVREGVVHRPWPTDVVLSFLAADVIKRNYVNEAPRSAIEIDDIP